MKIQCTKTFNMKRITTLLDILLYGSVFVPSLIDSIKEFSVKNLLLTVVWGILVVWKICSIFFIKNDADNTDSIDIEIDTDPKA